jgi:hypothetical protein
MEPAIFSQSFCLAAFKIAYDITLLASLLSNVLPSVTNMFSNRTEVYMTQVFQRLTKRYVNIVWILLGLAVISSPLLYSGCGMVTPASNIQANADPPPTPTPDTTPPTVTAVTPKAGANNVSVDTNVAATFSEAMITATVNGSTVELRDPSNALVLATVSYDTILFTVTLDPTASLAAGTTYTARVRGGVADPRVKDVAGNALAADVTWTFTTAPAPLQVVSTSPASGATGVSTGVAPRATFSKSLATTSVNTSTVLMHDASNNPVNVTVSCASSSIALAPQALLEPGKTYTVTLKGGANEPHITDSTGAALPSDHTWSFTTPTGPGPLTGLSIFTPTNPTTPAQPVFSDPKAVEVGLKFRSDKDGLITGVRFYKGGPENGGTHVGHLWTDSGTLLGAAAFNNETASGWQEAFFQNPISITANTIYVISYFAPQGNYAATIGQFQTSGVSKPPLRALSDAEANGNGVFHYSDTGGFPTDRSLNFTNFWVDVVFIDPATLDPRVLSTTPAPGAINVPAEVTPTATFSESLAPASVNASTVLLFDTANNPVTVNVSYTPGSFTLTLAPQESLQNGQTYTVVLKGGAAAPHITDASGTPLTTDYTWSFTTPPILPPPPPLPILVITGSGNKFTQYYQEILRAEGFNNFNSIDIAQLTADTLAQYDVTILGQTPLTSNQVTMLSNWVGAGGNLIAMRPDKKLASLLGLNDAASVRSDAYLLVNTAQDPGAGIVNQTIQYHSDADLYTLAGATQVALIYSSPTQATTNPAVTLRSVGTNGGQAAAFTFDLARSIVYTRQGNPAWAGQERDGHPDVIRPSDLFFPDFINLAKVEIPQADELQRLLANMIISMNMDKRPLPRFWYFPNMKKAVILMTGDDHADIDPRPVLNMLRDASPANCSLENWECYRSTSWMYTTSLLTSAEALNYHNLGFEMGVHVTTGCANWTPQTLDDFFTLDLASFAAKYTGIPAQKTNRTHCIAWSDWATQPKVELSHGIRLDESYYYWPPEWVLNRPGFMTGSGFPMRYADLDGTIIDVYQAATHLVNENGVDYPQGIISMLDKALGPEGYYGVFGTHYDYRGDGFELDVLNSARARNVSLITAQQLLTWLDGRNASSFGNPSWIGTQLAFSITVGPGASNLFAMIPNQTTRGQISSLTINGSPVAFTVETIKGRSYAVFRAANGTAVATYAATP